MHSNQASDVRKVKKQNMDLCELNQENRNRQKRAAAGAEMNVQIRIIVEHMRRHRTCPE